MNEGKPVVAERFIRTLKNKILKHMTTISKNVYFDGLDDIVDKYNNTVHKAIKMKPIDVTNDSYAVYNKDFNKKNPKFKVGGHVRISKYKNIFAKEYAPNWSEEGFVVSKIKNTIPWTYVINDLSYNNNCEKLVQKNLEQKKYSKENVINCMSNGKGMIIVLIVGLIKKISYKNESMLS